MQRLFSATRRLASKHQHRRRVPRSLQGLPTPNVHRSWGNMKHLTDNEKHELLHGTWRTSQPIQLVADKTDRDGGGFTEPVAFASEEEAARFLADEDIDDAAELQESTLQLAQRFFVELATAAGEELDAEAMPPEPQSDEARRREMQDVQRAFFGDFYVEQGLTTPAERYAFVDALLRPCRALFLVNSTLPLVRLTVRDQLEAHQHAAAATHAAASSSVFATTDLDPCLYVVPQVPTQAMGAPLYVPYTAATAALAESSESSANAGMDFVESDAHQTNVNVLPSSVGVAVPGTMGAEEAAAAIDTANALSAMLQDDFAGSSDNEPTAVRSGETEVRNSDNADVTTGSLSAPSSPSHQPPGLEHTYWLQRQIASNALLNVDILSHAVSLLSVHLAAASQGGGGVSETGTAEAAQATAAVQSPGTASHTSPVEVILYQADTTAEKAVRDAAVSSYHTEIAQYLFRAAQGATDDHVSSDAANCLRKVVLVVEDATFTPAASSRQERRRIRREHDSLATSQLCDRSDVSVSDRYPNVVYVTPARHTGAQRQPKSQKCTHIEDNDRSSTSSARDEVRAGEPTRMQLRGRVVVCAPVTSQDGVRPRGWLGSGAEDGEDNYKDDDSGDKANASASNLGTDRAAARRLFSTAAPNNFVERCQAANANFTRLQRCLMHAIRAVDVSGGCGCGGGGGWVVYVTQSMNVLENEAVVCAVLQQIEKESLQITDLTCNAQGRAAQDVSWQPLHVTCVPMTSPQVLAHFSRTSGTDGIRRIHHEGRPGFSTWVAIEGGSSAQEATQYPATLRAAVAQASWRTDPLRRGDDGGYLVCLHVTAKQNCAECPAPAYAAPPHKGLSPTLCWWTHPHSRLVCGVTPAAFALLQAIAPTQRHPHEERDRRPSRYTCATLHAGVPVGYVPASARDVDASQSVPALPSAAALSSATAHVEVAAALKAALPVLRLSALALSELLRTKAISSRHIRKQLRMLEKQLPVLPHGHDKSQYSNNSNIKTSDPVLAYGGKASVVQRESLAFLTAVETFLSRRDDAHKAEKEDSLSTRFNVVLEVDAASLVPAVGAPESLNPLPLHGLHPAVAAEALAAGVVAHMEFTRRAPPHSGGATASQSPHTFPSVTSSSSRALMPSSQYDFRLTLDVPLALPERVKHLAALEEWRVALRDALLYVARRTGAIVDPNPRLWGLATAPAEGAEADYASDSADAPSGVRVPRGDEEGLELAEDEYEAAADMPQRFQRQRGGLASNAAPAVSPAVDLFAEAMGPAGHKDEERGGDWLEDTNYREWRRRRSLK